MWSLPLWHEVWRPVCQLSPTVKECLGAFRNSPKFWSVLLNLGAEVEVRNGKLVSQLGTNYGFDSSKIHLVYALIPLAHAFLICLYLNSFLSKTTPRCLTDDFQAILLPLTRSSDESIFLLVMKMDSDFHSLILSLHSENHLWRERKWTSKGITKRDMTPSELMSLISSAQEAVITLGRLKMPEQKMLKRMEERGNLSHDWLSPIKPLSCTDLK